MRSAKLPYSATSTVFPCRNSEPAPHQNWSFAATCMILAGTRNEEITPKDADVDVTFGGLKFALLNTLNASPRNSTRQRSVILTTLCKAKSVWKNPGPVKMFRPAPYSPG